MSSSLPPTIPIYQRSDQLTKHSTKITSTYPYASHPENNQSLFKSPTQDAHIVTTASTIFHPQGGGQPSDVGTMHSPDGGVIFSVSSVRQGGDQVLHLGLYETGGQEFKNGEDVEQVIDAEQRYLFSRLHTAGHVLGLAARHYLDEQGVSGIVDGKASHFPGMANVEFLGLIDGKHKDGIQKKLDEYVTANMKVEIHEWDEVELLDPKNRVYMPENSMRLGDGGKLRVVSMVGAGAYPCGGTHVQTTGECGKVTVYKISRQKGMSKVSYRLD